MTIQIEQIGTEAFISHVEIARTSANYYYQRAEDKDFDLAGLTEKHTAAIKAHLIRMEGEGMQQHIQHRQFDVLADNAAFFELAQRYNWDETYFQAILEALGEAASSAGVTFSLLSNVRFLFSSSPPNRGVMNRTPSLLKPLGSLGTFYDAFNTLQLRALTRGGQNLAGENPACVSYSNGGV